MRRQQGADSTRPATFESVWQDLSRRLAQALAAEGVPRWLAEDVVQETGARMFERWNSLDTSSYLMPLARTVARNILIDHHRKHARVDLEGTPREVAAATDTESSALARLQLAVVQRSLAKLNPRYRRLLLSEAGFMSPDEHGPATRTARTRARQQLNLVLNGLSDVAWAFVLPAMHFVKIWKSRVMRSLSRPVHRDALGQMAAGLAVVVASLTVGTVGIPDEDPQHVQPAPAIPARAHLTTLDYSREGMHGSVSDTTAEKGGHTTASANGSGGSDLLEPGSLSNGESHSGGTLGPHGFDERGDGSGTLLGEPIRWKYNARYRNPECVRDALGGRPSLDCDRTPKARARAQVRHRGQHVKVDSHMPR